MEGHVDMDNTRKRKLLGMARVLACAVLLLVLTPQMEVRAANEYLLRVNLKTNVVTAYQNGTPVRAMRCTTGYNTPPNGRFRMGEQYRWHQLFGGLSGQYCSRITDHILFHSVPYTRLGDPSSLKPGNYDRLGTTASDGCVRLNFRDAKWIYDHCSSATTVTETFWGTAADDPLGKPEGIKVAGLPAEFYGWDPTDESPNSPFNKVGNYFGDAFDADYYAAHNPDVAAIWGNDPAALKVHWLRSGIKEWRDSSPKLNLKVYRDNYPDLQAALGNDPYKYVKHFLNSGLKEGREAVLRLGTEVNGDGTLVSHGENAVYRVYNWNTGEHFYTWNMTEVETMVKAGWDYEGFAWTGATPEEGGIPVYRLYSPSAQDHHYTINSNERDMLVTAGWKDEGVCWYSLPEEAGGTPLYRLYNKGKVGAGSHHYTANPAEKDMLVEAGWIYEGIGWRGR